MAGAANIIGGKNPPYTMCDFLTMYPQFDGLAPEPVVRAYMKLADTCVKKNRYKGHWEICMGLFIAHFVTLYLQSYVDPMENPDATAVVNAAEAHGVITSESVGGVSYSQDTHVAVDDLDGWAQWKLTAYGIQFASWARLLGKGGMYVW